MSAFAGLAAGAGRAATGAGRAAISGGRAAVSSGKSALRSGTRTAASGGKSLARGGKGAFSSLRGGLAARKQQSRSAIGKLGAPLKGIMARVDQKMKKKASQWGFYSPLLFWPYKTVILFLELLYGLTVFYVFFTLLQSVYFFPVVFIGFSAAWAPFQASQESFIQYLDIFASCIDGIINSLIRPIVNQGLQCFKSIIALYNWVVTFVQFNLKLIVDFFRGFVVQDLANVLENEFGVPSNIVTDILDFLDITEPPNFVCEFGDPDYLQCILDTVELPPINLNTIFECRGFTVYKEHMRKFYGVPHEALVAAKNETGTLETRTVMFHYDQLVQNESYIIKERMDKALHMANNQDGRRGTQADIFKKWQERTVFTRYYPDDSANEERMASRNSQKNGASQEEMERWNDVASYETNYDPEARFRAWKHSDARKQAETQLRSILESRDESVRFLISQFPVLGNGGEYLAALLEAFCDLFTDYYSDWLDIIVSVLNFFYQFAVFITEFIINNGISSLIDFFIALFDFIFGFILDIPCLGDAFGSEAEFSAALINCPCGYFTDALSLPYQPIDFTDPNTFLPAIFSCAALGCALDFGNDPATFSFTGFITDCIAQGLDEIFCDMNSDCDVGFECEDFVIPIITNLNIDFDPPDADFEQLGWCQSTSKRSTLIDSYIRAMRNQELAEQRSTQQPTQSGYNQAVRGLSTNFTVAYMTENMQVTENYIKTYFTGDMQYWKATYDNQTEFITMSDLINSKWNASMESKVSRFLAKHRQLSAQKTAAEKRHNEQQESIKRSEGDDQYTPVHPLAYLAIKPIETYLQMQRLLAGQILAQPIKAFASFYSMVGSFIYHRIDESAARVGAPVYQITWNQYDPHGRVVSVRGEPAHDVFGVNNGEEWKEDPSGDEWTEFGPFDNNTNHSSSNSHLFNVTRNETVYQNMEQEMEEHMSQGLTRAQIVLRAFSDVIADNLYVLDAIKWDANALELLYPSRTDMKNMFTKMKTQDKYAHAYKHVLAGAKEYNKNNDVYARFPGWLAQLEVVGDLLMTRFLAPQKLAALEKKLQDKSPEHAASMKENMPLFTESFDPETLMDRISNNETEIWDYHKYLRVTKKQKMKLYFENPRAFAKHMANLHEEKIRLFKRMETIMKEQELTAFGRSIPADYDESSFGSVFGGTRSSRSQMERIPALAPLFAMGSLAGTAAKPAADLTTGAFIFLIKNPQVLGTAIPLFWSTEPGRVLTVQIARALVSPLGTMYTIGLEKTFTPERQLEFVEDFGLALFNSFMYGITYSIRIVLCGWWSFIITTVRTLITVLTLIIPGLGSLIGIITDTFLTFFVSLSTIVPYCPTAPALVNFNPQVQPWNYLFNLLDCDPDHVCSTSDDCISGAPCRCSTKPQYTSLFWEIDGDRENEPCEDNIGMPTGTCLCWPLLPCDTSVGQSRFNEPFTHDCYSEFGYRQAFVSLSDTYSESHPGWWHNFKRFMRNLPHYISSYMVNWYNGMLFLSRFIAQGRRKYIGDSVSWFLVAIVFGIASITLSIRRLVQVVILSLIFIFGWQIYYEMLHNHVVPQMMKSEHTAGIGWFLRFWLSWVRYPNHSANNILGSMRGGESVCFGFNAGSLFGVTGWGALFLLLIYVLWTGGIISAILNYLVFDLLIPTSMIEYGRGRDPKKDGEDAEEGDQEGNGGGEEDLGNEKIGAAPFFDTQFETIEPSYWPHGIMPSDEEITEDTYNPEMFAFDESSFGTYTRGDTFHEGTHTQVLYPFTGSLHSHRE